MSRFAAIDIGSNAIRLMIAKVEPQKKQIRIRKEAFFRVPLRLGSEVFSHGTISATQQQNVVEAMKAFQHLLNVFKPISCRAYATSAMRDACNGQLTASLVHDQTGIELQIIDGQTEAQTVFSSHIQEQLDPQKSYLFIDVGGGSTELLLYRNGVIECSKSFNVGTVRILNKKLDRSEWQNMKAWVKEKISPTAPTGIGSGGNINRLNRMAKKEEKKNLTYQALKQIHQQIMKLDIDDRMVRYGLKPDRAEVIAPAAHIYLSIMEWGQIGTIHVPKSGLCDGLIRQQYDEFIATNTGKE